MAADSTRLNAYGDSVEARRMLSSKVSPERRYEPTRLETCSTEPKTISLSQSIPLSRADPTLANKMEQMALQIRTLQSDLQALKTEKRHEDCVPRRLLVSAEVQLDAALTDKEELQELRHSLLAEWRTAQNRAEQLQRQVDQLKKQSQPTDLSNLHEMAERLKDMDTHNLELIEENTSLKSQVTELTAHLKELQGREQILQAQLTAGEASMKAALQQKEERIKHLELNLTQLEAASDEANQCIREWLEVTSLTLAGMVEEATAKLTNELQVIGLVLDEKNQKLDALQDRLRVKLESSALFDPTSPCAVSRETLSRCIRSLKFEFTSLQALLRTTESPTKRQAEDKHRSGKVAAKMESLSRVIKTLSSLY